MRFVFAFIIFTTSCSAADKEVVYVASTPANAVVRQFIGIPVKDSVDFIRWRLVLKQSTFELDCRYGINKPNTNGFEKEQRITISGEVDKLEQYYTLIGKGSRLSLFELNANLLHIADDQKNLLAGNGGWSYVLNNTTPISTQSFHYLPLQQTPGSAMAFQGRTPCTELASMLGLEKSATCIKMKWYIILYTDSTGKPAHLQEGPRAERMNPSNSGSWEIIQQNGFSIYKLKTMRRPKPLYLVPASNNILLVCNEEGELLVGNEDFSYALNLTAEK